MVELLQLFAVLCFPFVIVDAATLIWPAPRDGARRLTPREGARIGASCRARLGFIAWLLGGIGAGALVDGLFGLPLTAAGIGVLGALYGFLVHLRGPQWAAN